MIYARLTPGFFAPLLSAWLSAGAIDRPDQASLVPQYLQSLQEGEPEAWRALFEAEMPSLFRYALGRLGRAEEAEEVVNQTFEEAWKGIPRYEDRGLPLRAWLFGIARNIVSRHRRRFMSRNAQVSLDAFEVEPTAEAEDPRLVEIAIAMSQIDQRHAEVLSLRYLHGLSARETAAVMKIGEEAVKSRQRRALEALRTRLDGGS